MSSLCQRLENNHFRPSKLEVTEGNVKKNVKTGDGVDISNITASQEHCKHRILV